MPSVITIPYKLIFASLLRLLSFHILVKTKLTKLWLLNLLLQNVKNRLIEFNDV
jgi:hypothetical protein